MTEVSSNVDLRDGIAILRRIAEGGVQRSPLPRVCATALLTEIKRLQKDLGVATTGLGAVIEAERRSSHETKLPQVRDVGVSVECDMRIVIASDTDVKVTDCFRAIDEALTALTEKHDVVLTIECITGNAVKATVKREPNDAVRWICSNCRTVNDNSDERCCVSSCIGQRPKNWPHATWCEIGNGAKCDCGYAENGSLSQTGEQK